MNHINTGKVEGNTYIKIISFDKAVLWKTRELSLQPKILWGLINTGVQELKFIDRGKGEEWTFDIKAVSQRAKLRKEGQEPQFYFPIEMAKKESLQKTLLF